MANNLCKSAAQVATDISSLAEFSVIRIYGVDCNQVTNVMSAISGRNIQLIAGIYNVHSAGDDANTLIQAINGNWGIIHTVTVGNEHVQDGLATVDEMISAIGQVRSMLRAAGYNGPVAIVDTAAIMKTPSGSALCTASDFCAVNCHAFFDDNTSASEAGQFVKSQVAQVSAAAGGKLTIVTESGWPTSCSPHGKATCSVADQQAAVGSLKSAFNNQNIVLFSAFNNNWKSDNAGTYGAEHFWGMFGNAPSGA
jgi:exo-beta-1,3-glucanase (GH17 family)